jgi:hypothetical protein
MINIAYFICVFYNYENSCHDEIGRSLLSPMLRDIGGIDIITKKKTEQNRLHTIKKHNLRLSYTLLERKVPTRAMTSAR